MRMLLWILICAGTLMPAASAATLVADVATGGYADFGDLQDPLTLEDITKTGGGTLQIGGSNTENSLTIQEGTAHFLEDSRWTSDSLAIGPGAVFKPTVNGFANGGYSMFGVNSFAAAAGARLEIGGISTLPGFSGSNLAWMSATNMISAATVTGIDNLQINNSLMSAHFEQNADTGAYNLVITNVRDLGTINGLGDYADAYRLNPNLSQFERDLLDSVYNRGDVGDAKGFFQTLGGQMVQNSLVALRHNQTNIAGNINRRLTAYQDEELARGRLSVDSSGLFSEEDPAAHYSEMWAFVDHGWTNQEDDGDFAGYQMTTTTLGAGYDWHIDQLIYGGLLSYARNDMKLQNNRATTTTADAVTAAAYASWAQDGWYISGTAMASYGFNDTISSYGVPGLSIEGSAEGYATAALGLNAEGGYMMETELAGFPLRITPYGGLTYSYMHRDNVSESGAQGGGANLRRNFRSSDWRTLDGTVGLRVAAPIEVNGISVVPSVDVAWTRITGEQTSEKGTVHMYNNPNGAWDLDIMSSSRNTLRIAAGVEAKIRENVSVGASFQTEWRSEYWNNRLNVNMSVGF